jgi:hypothetical protein
VIRKTAWIKYVQSNTLFSPYRIASDHPDEFESKAGYADPCRDPVSVSGSNDDAGCKWPPTLLVWSSTDQVLPMEEQAGKYAALLRARGIAVDDIWGS